ncbi:MAG: Rpn family recombination-promoting nuclease/putative transposase [Schwartzia sp. (in: firmicutes)]
MHIKPWEELTIRDDYMFKLVMRKKHICKKMLELILQIHIRDIRYIEEEKNLKFQYAGKGVRLDVYVADDKNTVYNVEMQVNEPTETELAKRTRYYQSVIDTDLLEAGKDYEELNDTYIIFICPFDPFKEGRHIYTFCSTCREDTTLTLKDGATKVFLNAVGIGDDVPEDVKAFLKYMNGVLSQDAFVQEIEQEIQTVKEVEQERVSYMTFEMRLRDEWKVGWKEGREEGELSMIRKLLREAAPMELIQRVSGWTKEQILAAKEGAAPETKG